MPTVRSSATLYELTKRLFDILLSLVLLVLLAPLLLVIALTVRISSPGPVLYRQARCGRHGQTFTCFKFRSMVADADKLQANITDLNEISGPVFKMRRDPRVTPVGRWLRKLSLDELPQLWNVLRGDMSMVGPRPPLPSEVALYDARQWQRLDVTPGLTCLWQVSGRSDLTFDRWVELDLEYIRRRSFAFDLWLVVLTIPAVITGRGAF